MVVIRGILNVSIARLMLGILLALLVSVTWGGATREVQATHLPKLIAVVPVGNHVRSVAVNPVTNRIYVGNENEGTLSVINGATNTEIDIDGNPANGMTRIALGSVPTAVAVNPATNRVFVSNFGSGTVSVVDGATNTEIDTDGNSGNGVTRINVGGSPTGIAVNQALNRVYVANLASDDLDVIDGSTYAIIATVPVGSDPHPFGVAVNSGANRVYVANNASGDVSVIDTTTNTEIDTDGNSGNGLTRIAVGGNPSGIGVNANTGRVYVATTTGSSVKVIDGSTNAVIATVPVSGTPNGVAVDSSSNRLYVTREFASLLTVIDAATNTTISDVPLSNYPFAVAVNSTTGRVYVASWSSNVLTVMSFPDHPLDVKLVNFQGRLTDSTGNPVPNGNYSLTFRIYDSATGGTVKWQETQNVAVAGSVFSVLLGSVNPLEAGHFSGAPRYLEVQVGSDPPMTPRQQFTSVPYAFNSQSLDGLGASQFLRRDTNDSYLGAQLGINGTLRFVSAIGGDTQLQLTANAEGSVQYDPIFRMTGENGLTSEGFAIRYDNDVGDVYLDHVWSSGTNAFHIRTQTSGTPIEAVTIQRQGNVGIGATNPQSSLQIGSGYLQLPTIAGAAPPAADCDAPAEAGRIIVRTDGAINLYICTGSTGWVGK